MTIAEDGTHAAWVARATLQFEDAATGTFVPRAQFEDFIGAAVFSPRGDAFATARAGRDRDGLEGIVQVWDPATGAERVRITQQALPAAVAFAPRAAVLAVGDEGFSLWDIEDAAKPRRLTGFGTGDAGLVRLIAFSPDGFTLATGDNEDNIRLWRAVP